MANNTASKMELLPTPEGPDNRVIPSGDN